MVERALLIEEQVWMTLSGWSAISKEKPNLYAGILFSLFTSRSISLSCYQV